uniref:Uncharacterized protein n=1 Tax=Amphimedon queenslandica TaxID=400682 RepID=A0A1X7TDR4_AMPQE
MWYIFSIGAVASITPHDMNASRAILNDSVLDIMFYVSTWFGPEVSSFIFLMVCIGSCTRNTYNEFTRRNFDFISNNGTVSMFAHLLGNLVT